MKKLTINPALASGSTTIRQLRGITEEEYRSAVSAARKLIAAGAEQDGLEVLAGLVLYDPFLPEVWRELEAFCRRKGEAQAASLFAGLARVMAA
jgi:cytosine/adenosine deaminase-related metal-dependent hydrolase